MRKTVDWLVIACMFVAVYINWTDFPRPQPVREVTGLLEKTK
jgi:hypothetical protein